LQMAFSANMFAAIGLVRTTQCNSRGLKMAAKAKKMDYSKKTFIVIGTHGEEDIEKATMTFACASASASMGIKTKVFLTGNGVKLAQKGFAKKLPSVKGMASIDELMAGFKDCCGRLLVCIPCLESRGIKKQSFVDGTQFISLMDFAAETLDADRVFTC
jgi:predicted peroxiredoxin